MATILMIFLRINCKISSPPQSTAISDFLKIHNLTFEDAQINFYYT